jgi:hypothetical protein
LAQHSLADPALQALRDQAVQHHGPINVVPAYNDSQKCVVKIIWQQLLSILMCY